MKITIMVVGKLKKSYLQDAEADYVKRLRPYCKLDIVEKKDEAAVVAALPKDAHVYALDERGELVSSIDFAEKLLGKEALHGGGAPIVFLIGGPDGHSRELRRSARRLLAFGRITIAHRLVRVLLLEQIYRGFKILRNEPYHRG